MLPEAFRKRIEQQSYINGEELFRALEEPSPATIRINRSKWDHDPLNSRPVPWCRNGFYLDTHPSFTLDPLFHAGCYYPQEASGMFLEEVIKQTAGDKPDIKVLDLCGAPGGKSTHLSALIGRNGFLVANEVIRMRAAILAENITKWGLSNTIVTQNDPSSFTRLAGFFDLILVDAPCSGEGMFRNITAVNEWSEENAGLCSERQKRILMDVWPALKENGVLVYSTCTFNPGENEENIKWLAGKHEAETITLDISDFTGITEIDYQGIHGYGFYPGKIMGEGFFISAIRKRSKQQEPDFGRKLNNAGRITVKVKTIVKEWTRFSAENIIRLGNELIVPACGYNDYLTLSGFLRITKAGTKICTIKGDDHLPSHETAMSDCFKKESFPTVDAGLDQALSYLSRGQFAAENVQKGWNIVQYNRVNLGFINNIGSRINNYYPVDWRIRMRRPEQVKEDIIKWNTH